MVFFFFFGLEMIMEETGVVWYLQFTLNMYNFKKLSEDIVIYVFVNLTSKSRLMS